jgi:hypothetical protein
MGIWPEPNKTYVKSNLEVSLDQNNNGQGTAIEDVTVHRISERKKVPITRNNDFFNGN